MMPELLAKEGATITSPIARAIVDSLAIFGDDERGSEGGPGHLLHNSLLTIGAP
jgi:hypothetical protein